MGQARRPPAVGRVLTQVTATVRTHGLAHPGNLVLAAVSGGPDSVCLLYSMWLLRRLLRIRVAAFHFDHRLRPDSAADAGYVRRLCARLQVPLHVREALDAPPRGASVEAWATAARSQALVEVGRSIGADVLAEGHTLDDQAETVLLNLVRGTGLEGLAGIDPGGSTIQPLLEVTRDEVEAFCRSLHLRPRRDPMNEDPRYLRAVLRARVLPVLEEATGRGVARSIARTGANLRADRDALAVAAALAYDRSVERPGRATVRLDAAELGALPRAVSARVVRLVGYEAMRDGVAPWPRSAIEAVLDLVDGRPGRRRELPDGWTARRGRTHVILERTS
jgi:tRNA(Ile)-lysidine synthase